MPVGRCSHMSAVASSPRPSRSRASASSSRWRILIYDASGSLLVSESAPAAVWRSHSESLSSQTPLPVLNFPRRDAALGLVAAPMSGQVRSGLLLGRSLGP
jgi:hypothetical protein